MVNLHVRLNSVCYSLCVVALALLLGLRKVCLQDPSYCMLHLSVLLQIPSTEQTLQRSQTFLQKRHKLMLISFARNP